MFLLLLQNRFVLFLCCHFRMNIAISNTECCDCLYYVAVKGVSNGSSAAQRVIRLVQVRQ